jgi:hypothetical protein
LEFHDTDIFSVLYFFHNLEACYISMEISEYSFPVEKSHMHLLRNGRTSVFNSSPQNPKKYRLEVTVLMNKMSPS